MKTKNVSILLFILLFTGAILFSSTRALAQVDARDCDCTDEEISLQACADVGGYVIQPYFDVDTADPIGAGKWPIINAANGTKEWRYKICSNATKKKCRTLSSWNYFVYVLPWQEGENSVDYYLSSIPPGASLLLPGDLVSPKCKDMTVPAEHDAVKVNPSVNCGDEVGVVTSIFTNLEPQSGYCLETYAVLSQECLRADLRGPAFDVLPPEPVRYFCDNRIVVRSNVCTQEIESVTINGTEASISIPGAGDAQFCSYNENGDPACHSLLACGAGIGGCYICIDNPIYINGDTVYYVP